MVFEVTEIKALGGNVNTAGGFHAGLDSLSLRLQAKLYTGDARIFTIHAVVPYSPEFATVQVGQKFKFEQKTDERLDDLNRRLRSRDLTCDEAGCEGTPTTGMKHAEGCSMGYIKGSNVNTKLAPAPGYVKGSNVNTKLAK